MSHQCTCSRRTFMAGSIGCGAYVALALSGAAGLSRRAFAAIPAGETILTKPFSRVEKIADGVWASIATPSVANDYTTVSNGGIIAGRDAVLLIEGHNTHAGGAWAAQTAKQLTGRWPTHVVVTHLHGDHTNGLSGCLSPTEQVRVLATNWTRTNLAQRATQNTPEFDDASNRADLPIATVLPDVVINDDATSTTLDLGGRTVTLRLRKGHTPSDLTIEIDNPRVVFCGDLVFHQTFPYYGDAIPTTLSRTCRELCTDPDTLYVPGHGSLATADDLTPYLEMLDHIGDAARTAFDRGIPAPDAAAAYALPERFSDVFIWNPKVFEYAFEAWYRELEG